MVRDGFGDESGAKLIDQRGIDFAPSEDFIQTLKAAGASEAFLNALRAAKPPEPASAKKPLNQVEVFALLAGQVPSHRVTMLVQERGIDFDPTNDYLQEVRLAGGEDELISALKGAKVTKPATVDPAAQARQAQVQQHVARGAELGNKGQYPEAEQEYRAALLLDSQNPDLYLGLAYVLDQQKRWDDAAAAARQAVRLNPNDDVAHYDLGAALAEKGDRDGAMAEAREALRLNPNNDLAHDNLGSALEKKGDLDGAIAEYREAVRLNPNSSRRHSDLGSALGKRGDLGGAIAEHREAVRLNPKDENAHLLLGLDLEGKGDVDGAVVEYREVLRLNPNNELAHSSLDRALKSTRKPRVLVEFWEGSWMWKPQKQPNPAAEMTAFAHNCTQSTVTVDERSADYTLRLSMDVDNHSYGYTLFDHQGNMVGSQDVSPSLIEAAQGACKAVVSNWNAR
jgi:Flp pilus assembly protein TadD